MNEPEVVTPNLKLVLPAVDSPASLAILLLNGAIQAIDALVPALTFKYRGAWAIGTAYAVNDVVSYNGTAYIAILAGTGQEPDTATTYWDVLAAGA